MTLDTLLSECEWIAMPRLRQLARLGYDRVRDLLEHYPRRYENRMQFDRFPDQEQETAVCLCGVVSATSLKRLGGWRRMFEVTLEEESHALSRSLVCRWFNSPWVQKAVATGQRVVIYGKPKRRGRKICMDHPEFEVVESDDEVSIHLKRITPVYRSTEGLSSRVIRALIFRLLTETDLTALPSPLPAELETIPFCEALAQIHFPSSWEQLEAARRSLVLGEFFQLQLFVGAKRAGNRALRRTPHCGKGRLMERFLEGLPFELTGAQRRAIEEIREDLERPFPMNRLLHGDVGSGKTLVAVSAMLLAVEAGCQAALMAPTQILAEQHYLNCRRWLSPLGIRIALRTGARREDTSLPLFDQNSSDFDEPQVIIGTHALLYDGSDFRRLGLAVIDEQHKFGVMQRARLMSRGELPDVLVMTATPIPRTLTMTAFGDLDVSTIDEMPAERGRIVTAVRDASRIPDVIRFLREKLEAGRQGYIVYPLIDESSKLESKAAAAEYERWCGILSPMPVELLHGRMDPGEKERVMDRFRRGEVKVLVATSVIEVGIDVPNATWMLIENAERFGLAQLHQLRGRIGRGRHRSYCILISSGENPEAMERLRILEQTSNGFEIAEVDLRLRGPGDLLGTAQSGLPPLKLGDLVTDVELMKSARHAVVRLFSEDPELGRPENQRFRPVLVESRKLALAGVS